MARFLSQIGMESWVPFLAVFLDLADIQLLAALLLPCSLEIVDLGMGMGLAAINQTTAGFMVKLFMCGMAFY